MTAATKPPKNKPLPMLAVDVLIQNRTAHMAEVEKELAAATALHSEQETNLPAIEQTFEAKTAERETLKSTEQALENEMIAAASKNGDMDAISARSVAVANELAALDKQIMHLGAAQARLRLLISETRSKKFDLQISARSAKTALDEAHFQKRYGEFLMAASEDFSEHVITTFIRSQFSDLHYVRQQMKPIAAEEPATSAAQSPDAEVDAWHKAHPAQPGMFNPSAKSLVSFGCPNPAPESAANTPRQEPELEGVVLGEGLPESAD